MDDLEHLLFTESLASDDGPLFKTKIQLARALQEQTFPGRSVESVRSSLYQILSGESEASETFAQGLLTLVGNRIEKGNRDVRSRIAHALSVSQTAQDLAELREAAEVAKHHFIVTAHPAENLNTEQATRLKENLVRRLGLIDDNSSGVRYEFCVPDESVANDLWRNIVDTVSSLSGISKSEAAARVARTNKAKNLLVRVGNYAITFPPYVVYDPQDVIDARAFVFEYTHPSKRVDYIELSALNKFTFVTRIYQAVCDGSDEWGIDKVPNLIPETQDNEII